MFGLSNEFWILLAAFIAYTIISLVIDRKWGRALLRKDFSERESKLLVSIEDAKRAAERMAATIEVLNDANRDKDRQLVELRFELDRQRELRRTLESNVSNLEQELHELRAQLRQKNIVDGTKRVVVLGIWPDAPGQDQLDQQGEMDAIYNAGVSVVPLRGVRASRPGVISEIERLRPTIIQCGGHGSKDGILLSDGLAEPGWWGAVVAGSDISLMVLLSCESNIQDEYNVVDALIDNGVAAVVGVSGEIPDVDAVRFAKMLYPRLRDGMTLEGAVNRAKLSLPRTSYHMIRLREKR